MSSPSTITQEAIKTKGAYLLRIKDVLPAQMSLLMTLSPAPRSQLTEALKTSQFSFLVTARALEYQSQLPPGFTDLLWAARPLEHPRKPPHNLAHANVDRIAAAAARKHALNRASLEETLKQFDL